MKILVAGMSRDSFTESMFKNLVRKGYSIDSFTGFEEWNSESINETIYAIPALTPYGVKMSFPGTRPAILDKELLSYFEAARPFFLRVVDRFLIRPLPEREIEQYFNECVSYILGFLQEKGPYNLCFSLYAPHSPTGIITYFACKFLGIPYYFGVRTLLPDLVMFSDDFEADNPEFFYFDQAHLNRDININTIDEIRELLSKDSWLLEAGKSINKTGNWYLAKKNHSNNLAAKLARLPFLIPFIPTIKLILDMLKLIFFGKFLRNEFYKLKRAEALVWIFKNILHTLKLRKWIKHNNVQFSEQENYFYFSMHYQPERTTDPEAGYFTQQYLAISLLAHSLPEGYKLYVKDHPRQFRDHIDISKLHFRDIKEYELINSLPNTSFVDPELDSAPIVKNAKLVSSCTGSALWEALTHGVPAISFGFTWHADCKSCINISSRESLEDAIGYLLSKNRKEVLGDVYQFILRNKNAFVQTHFGLIMAMESELDIEKSAKNFSEALDQLASIQKKK